jgi:diguanylate cyclase (GGDEF)-like protein
MPPDINDKKTGIEIMKSAGFHTDSEERYWMLYEHGVLIALVIHAAFIVLFYFIGSALMAAFNVGSVLLYALCIKLIHAGYRNLVIVLCWLEVLTHAVLAVRSIGWDSGFHYYLLVIIPLIYASSSRKVINIILMTLLICMSYILMDAYMRTVDPYISVSRNALDYIRYANILFTFGFLGYIAFVYVHTVALAEKQLLLQATTDPLTRLYNRRYLLEIAGYELKQFNRSRKPFSFIICDLDDFKNINDRYGHEAGDRALMTVSDLLRNQLRENDSIARWGGEEFLILMPDTSIDSANEIAGRIRNSIAAAQLKLGKANLPLTMTMGVSEIRPGETIDACISRADQALYRGKQSGKNRVMVAPH